MKADLLLGGDWVREVHSAPGYAFGIAPPEESTIAGVLARQAARMPDAPFLTSLDTLSTLTYSEAWSEVRRRAAVLQSWGLRRGDRVGIIGQNSADIALAVLASIEAGAVTVLLNHKDPEARIAGRAEFTGVRFVLCEEGFPLDAERICTFAELAGLTAEAPSVQSIDFAAPRSTDGALIFFTSGTTGMPKAVVQSHYAVAQNAISLARHHRIGPGSRLLCVLPLHHVNGLEFTILGALCGGGHTILARGFDGLRFWGIVDEHRIEIASLVPNLIRLLAERPKLRASRGSSLKYVVSAAAPLSIAVAENAWSRLKLRIVQGYGLSEVTNFTCVLPAGLSDAEYERRMLGGRRTTIGPALPGQQVRIDAANPGDEGEILIRGHCTMSGYLNNQVATDEIFAGGWFHSGDLGYEVDGYIHVSGRLREIAKRSGAMINLLEVDEVLASIPGVADFAAAAFPNQWVDEEIGAAIVREPGSDVSEESILRSCRERVPFAESPKAIVFVDEVPRTATGKVRRGEIAGEFGGHATRLFVPPQLEK
jgi:acyl-CoA synthetase (AMP-forming)/AMP-acid ligase II